MTTRGRPSRESVYQTLRTQINELRDRMAGLPNPLEAAHIWKDIWFQEAHHSTAPEGTHSCAIGTFPGGMRPCAWPEVPAEMRDWIRQVNRLDPASTTFPSELADVHCRFEQIHPFLDGNGRTGRLVLNLILVRLGYPPAIIYTGERARYLRALRRADQGDPGALGEIIARAVLENLYRFVVPAVAGPARLVPLPALATGELSVTALRLAAGRGRLQATKGPDGHWRSSQQWVADYVASRYRRATPPGENEPD